MGRHRATGLAPVVAVPSLVVAVPSLVDVA
jgi:hypothetical protein